MNDKSKEDTLSEWRYSSTPSRPLYQMEVSGHPHNMAALPSGKESPVLTEQEAVVNL